MLMKGDGARVHYGSVNLSPRVHRFYADSKRNTCLHPLRLPACTAVCMRLRACECVQPPPTYPLRGHMVVGLDWDWRLVATAISQPVISLSTARINLPTDGWLLGITSWNTHTDIHCIHIDSDHPNQCLYIYQHLHSHPEHPLHHTSIIHSDCTT